MTRDDIIRMAVEAGGGTPEWDGIWELSGDALERFAALVAAAEREACVELCLEHSKLNVDNENVEFSHLASYEFGKQVGAATCATAIRARGEV